VKRRQFIAGLGGAAAWPLVARAQQAERVRRIGAIWYDVDNAVERELRDEFTGRLRELGWIEGRNHLVAALVHAGALLINHIAPGNRTLAPSA
jgi:putative ABC transport system substrate-binding protein